MGETNDLAERIASLRLAVDWGCLSGKRNVIADLDALTELFRQRDELLAACKGEAGRAKAIVFMHNPNHPKAVRAQALLDAIAHCEQEPPRA